MYLQAVGQVDPEFLYRQCFLECQFDPSLLLRQYVQLLQYTLVDLYTAVHTDCHNVTFLAYSLVKQTTVAFS